MAHIDDLIRQLPPDDPRLSEALVSEYYNFVYHLAGSILNDPGEADDAAQETFINALRSIHTYQPVTNFKAWLARITINGCRSRLRKRRSRQALANALQLKWLHAPPFEPSPEEEMVRSERHRGLRQAVEQLDEKHRIPVLLRYVYGMSTPEIADILEVPEGTVHSRLHYAYRDLRRRLSISSIESHCTLEEER